MQTELLSRIREGFATKEIIRLLVAEDVITPDAGNTAVDNIMSKTRDQIIKYVDSIHFWGENDRLPRKKNRSDGKPVEYYMTRVNINGKRKQITASSLEGLYKKLYDLYSYEKPTTLSKLATLRDVYNLFISKRSTDASENHSISSVTVSIDKQMWNKYFEQSVLAETRVTEISSSRVLNEFKKITGPGNLDRKAFNKVKGLLDAILDIAIDEGIIDNNPSRYIPRKNLKFRPPTDNRNKVYTKEECSKLLKYISTLEPTVYSLAIELAFCFCIRIGELRALTWDDYDEKNHTLKIWHSISEYAEGNKNRVAHDVPHTKSNSSAGIRTLIVSDTARDVLCKLREINGNKHYILNSSCKGKMPISTHRFNDHLRMYCKEAGINYYSSHKIRFFGATALFDAGVDAETIRRVLGHTTTAMSEHYNRTKGNIDIDTNTWNSIYSFKI